MLLITMLKLTFKNINLYNKSREEKLNLIFKIKKQKRFKNTYKIQKFLNK